MKSFVSLDYIEMLEDAYEQYIEDCIKEDKEPLTKQEWYKQEWSM